MTSGSVAGGGGGVGIVSRLREETRDSTGASISESSPSTREALGGGAGMVSVRGLSSFGSDEDRDGVMTLVRYHGTSEEKRRTAVSSAHVLHAQLREQVAALPLLLGREHGWAVLRKAVESALAMGSSMRA